MINQQKRIVLDANILIRAVLGIKVIRLLTLYRNVKFFSPDACFEDARKYIPLLIQKRSGRSDSVNNTIEILLFDHDRTAAIIFWIHCCSLSYRARRSFTK